MADPRLTTIRIRTGVIRRLTREKISYEKEADTERDKIGRSKAEAYEEEVTKKLEEGLQMTLGMIIDCQNRLLEAYNECKEILEAGQDLKETEEYVGAVKVMDVAKEHLPCIQSAPDDANLEAGAN